MTPRVHLNWCTVTRSAVVLLLVTVLVTSAAGQNRFRDPIPTGDIQVRIEDFATIPFSDTRNRQPPRMSVLTTDPNGRLFVNDQRGPLYTIDSTGSQVTEYFDIRDFPDIRITSANGEAGFQGFAFHPDFAREGADGFGRLYTIHSSTSRTNPPDFDPGGSRAFDTLLLEWHSADPLADTFAPADANAPYREIMRLKQPFGNHNAGNVAFNPTATEGDSDYGNLYVAIGDGGSGGDPQDNGQDASNPFGAILRIDPRGTNGINGQYGIVSDNVLAGDNDPNTLGEIYSYGLRNPQRFGWDTQTGALYIADIGQGVIEEIDLAVNGGNFGWDDREGSFPFDSNNTQGLIDPVAEYDHTNVVTGLSNVTGGRAVTTGEVVRDSDIPGLNGQLMVGDFPTGLLFTLDVDNDPLDGGQDGLRELQPLDDDLQPVRMIDLINETRGDLGLSVSQRADVRFGINTPGEVFITNKHDGVVRRLSVIPDALGDCNLDTRLDAADLACVGSIEERDTVLTALNTLPGDIDGDGDVAFSDFVVLAVNFGQDLASYTDGNLDLEGGVNLEDFIILSTNFGRTPGQVQAMSVPEPSVLPLIVFGWLVGMSLRRRVPRRLEA